MIDSSTLEKLEFHKVLTYIANYSITESGKQKIISIKPLDDYGSILNEGNFVSEAKEILIKTVPPPIDFIPNLDDDLVKSKIDGAVLSGKKINEIFKLAVISRKLVNFLKENKETSPTLYDKCKTLFIDKIFEHHIEKVIDENGEVKENASKVLKELRKEILEKKNDLVRSINKIMKNLSEQDIVQEDYLTLRDGRMVIPVKAEHKRHLKGFIHSESATGQTVYIEPEETLELNNDIVSLSFAEKREIERLLKELTKLIGKVEKELRNSLNTVAELDSIFARAKYSVEVIGSFPGLDKTRKFEIHDARHPVLLRKLGREKTVPLALKLEDEKVIIITGPNAGGKTVILKTIGLLTALVHSGIHIPVNPDSNFPFLNKILIDIGDEQSIEDDLSTFSSHLKNIKLVLDQADENSLILLDEIGTGTDPEEGSSLAASVLIKLRDLGSIVFASTHHGSLKLISNEEKNFSNAAMEFDNERLSPTYNFKLGIPGSSYAFEIARRIGIDEKLLELASHNIDADKHKIEEFLVDIERKSTKLEKQLKELEIENSRLKGLTSLYKNNLDKLEKEKKEILKKTKIDAESYLANVNKKIENAVKEIRESGANREVIKTARQVVQNLRKETEELVKPEIETEHAELKVGDFVKLKNTSTSGKIFSIEKNKKRAILQVGSVKMKVNVDELVQDKEKKDEKYKAIYSGYTVPTTNYRLDIRGERPGEAEFKIIKFIDDSYMSGQNRIEILHGKGTGALKNVVNIILKEHINVKDYYFAPIESGGEGITIVELK